jgi:hypothetical protein
MESRVLTQLGLTHHQAMTGRSAGQEVLWNPLSRKRTVKAVLTRSRYLEFGQALVAEAVANVGQEELAFRFG